MISVQEVQSLIDKCGGKIWAQQYSEALHSKLVKIQNNGSYGDLLLQTLSSREQGDLRGRLLEVNFLHAFLEKNIPISYGVKQGMVGDIDFLRTVNGNNYFIEMKLKRQLDIEKNDVEEQLRATQFYSINIDEFKNIEAVQKDILYKAGQNKFNRIIKAGHYNFVGVDVSELMGGMLDYADCHLVVYGNNGLASVYQRDGIIGLFDSEFPYADIRTYIHGIIFLFRNPKEPAALTYDLTALVLCNTSLISNSAAKDFAQDFYQAIPLKQ